MSSAPPSLDTVATINEDGSRKFVYPAFVRGRYAMARALLRIVLLVIYVALPWIQVGGNPAVFLDVAHGKFHLFGVTFASQDVWLVFFIVTGAAFGLFYVTALFGRIWCGWGCPQTVILDLARWIERTIEGDPTQRKQLAQSIWTLSKTVKRAAKHGFYLLLAFGLANLFLSYFVSLRELYHWTHSSPLEHWSAFLFVSGITAALWFDLAWFREQFCIILCPYGRLQSALIDNDTFVIGYDATRGEPRGKKGTANAGDCVDCRKCIQVCPTGIDIRQGLQLECIACSACIDACDGIMDKLGREKGLIRHDSHNGFSRQRKRMIRPRLIVYTFLLALGLMGAGIAATTITPANVNMTRLTGPPYYLQDGVIRNQFMLRVTSKRNQPEVFDIQLVNPPPGVELRSDHPDMQVPPLGEGMLPVVLTMRRADFTRQFPITLRVFNQKGDITLERSVAFLGPQTL